MVLLTEKQAAFFGAAGDVSGQVIWRPLAHQDRPSSYGIPVGDSGLLMEKSGLPLPALLKASNYFSRHE